jgi:anti-sigma B factor antagonist
LLDPTMPRPSPGPGELGVTYEQPDGRHALLVVEGEIDTLTAGALERALRGLLEDTSEVLVVDLTAVTFLASSGLAVLIRAAHEAGERRLRLVSTARAVRRPMEITGSDQLFDLYPDRTAAFSPEV